MTTEYIVYPGCLECAKLELGYLMSHTKRSRARWIKMIEKHTAKHEPAAAKMPKAQS